MCCCPFPKLVLDSSLCSLSTAGQSSPFHLLSSIAMFITDISAPILPILVDECLKRYLTFQWDLGFSGVSGDSESDTCSVYHLYWNLSHSLFKPCNLATISQFYYCSFLMNNLLVKSKIFPFLVVLIFFNGLWHCWPSCSCISSTPSLTFLLSSLPPTLMKHQCYAFSLF